MGSRCPGRGRRAPGDAGSGNTWRDEARRGAVRAREDLGDGVSDDRRRYAAGVTASSATAIAAPAYDRHLCLWSARISSSAASSLTRIAPRAQTTTARASLSLREHAAYEDALASPHSF